MVGGMSMPRRRQPQINRLLKWNINSGSRLKSMSGMMWLKRRLIHSLAGCLLLSASVYATEAVHKNQLDLFLEELESFSADFEQNIIDEFGEVVETSRGIVQLRRPGMFLWEYQEPYLQKIISDGSTLWLFDEDLEQVTINDAVMTVEDAPALIFTDDFPITEHYVVVELDDEEQTAWIELTPRDLNSQYRVLRLGFLNNDFKSMILVGGFGQTTLLTFTDTSRNPELSRDMFQFSPPENIDIIDSRKQAGQR